MQETKRAKDYAEAEDLVRMFDSAKENTKTKWEIDFISDLEAKFDIYGDEMYMTDRQWEVFARLAGDYQ